MKPLFFVLISILALCNLTGCVSIHENMKSWMGHNFNDLIANWGPPQSTMPDGQGGQILIYSKNKEGTTPGQARTNTYGPANTHGNLYGNTYNGNSIVNTTSTTTYTPAQTHGYDATRTFWANKQGTIYRWSWKGL
jgi:hypothetical protein